MDEIALLRSMRDQPEPPTESAIAAGRQALEDAISGGRRHSRRRRALWGSGLGGAAGGLVAALVLTDVIGLGGWRGGAQPAAAAVLHSAAVAAIKTSDPVVRPGQYLKVSTVAVYGAFTDTAGYLATQNGQLYIPATRSDDWVWVRDPSTVAQTFGPASEKAARADGNSGGTEIVRAPEGAFYNGPPQDDGLDALPRDPTRLLNHIYRVTLGAGVSRDGEALVFIADTLRTGVVPADLRAALYNAAAQIPGVEVIDREANLDGRIGVALGRNESDGIRQEIIIDPRTGQLIGERQVLTRDGVVPGWPAGTPEGYTAVTTTVVDSAPTGGTICGGLGKPAGGVGSGICRD
jgi:RNA polymerase sigma-70 factor (ECF subfamily)